VLLFSLIFLFSPTLSQQLVQLSIDLKMPPKASKGESNEWVDPVNLRFTHSKIRPIFSDGHLVEETLAELVAGRLQVSDLPQIVVHKLDHQHYFSLNNRRLWVLKQLRDRGLLKDNKVLVRVRPMPDSRRLGEKFSLERCAEQARFMREKIPGRSGDGDAASDDSEETESPASAIPAVSAAPAPAPSRRARRAAKSSGAGPAAPKPDPIVAHASKPTAEINSSGEDDDDDAAAAVVIDPYAQPAGMARRRGRR
jgi:hypothetical protein